MKWVLCVDDDEQVRKYTCEALSFLGHEPHGAQNAEEALRLFEQYPYDLVITDYDMPGKNGLELSKQITTIKPSLPVILITANAALRDADNLKQCGIVHVLFKPASLEEIEKSVKAALSNSNGITSVDVLA